MKAPSHPKGHSLGTIHILRKRIFRTPYSPWPAMQAYTLGDTGLFKLQGIKAGIVKSTVFGVFQDLKFKISEGYKQN